MTSVTRGGAFQRDQPSPRLPMACGPQPVADCWCVLRLHIQANLFPHWSQRKGFSPVWTLWCFFRLPASEKRFPQKSQRKGFSPVWTLSWASRLERPEKAFPHALHT
ncbi:hypothetical protein EYF80_026998 [Liparis tanakae]|uniref:Uncharacterized protein n=1 Tax=Liparis tanakae TaxID=230148 RepID=A0A4Z2HDA2_9TELE|nr:hypothetical protein EYF80_026998 [Liparis tanakae]